MAENPDPVTQMNVRVPRSLIAAVDTRRAVTGLSRDKWVASAIEHVLRYTAPPEPAPSQETPT